MLINFFFTLRAAKLPVSVKEYLTLLEAIREGVIDDSEAGGPGPTVDKFYYLARATLVKDEAHYDRFDRAFAAYFKGVELLADFTREVPLEWLQKRLELELSPEEKAAIEKMGWDELMETLKKRFEEQKGRHEGGSKWIGTGGTSPFGAWGYNPQGIRIGQDGGRGKSAVKVWDQRQFKDYDDSVELGTRNIKVALRRLRRFAREGALDELDLDDTIRSTAANAGWLDLKMVPERHNRVKVLLLMDVGGTMDEHVHRVEELFSAAKHEFKHLEFYLLPQLRLRLRVEEQPPPLQREVPDRRAAAHLQPRLQAGARRRRDDEPVRDPAKRRQRRIQQRGERCRMAAAAHAGVSEVRLDQPRAAGRLGIPPEHRHHPAAHEPAHVPAHAAGTRRGDAPARQMTAPPAPRRHPRPLRGAARACAAALALAALGGCAMFGDRKDESAAVARDPAAGPPPGTGLAAGDRASWRLEVAAPPPLRKLLVDYLDLSRFQAAAGDEGVTPAELSRLIATAPAQARSLLETEGYFNAEVSVEREDGTPPLVRVRVEPGPRTTVAKVDVRARGPLQQAAEAGDAAAARIRRQLGRDFALPVGEPWRQSDWSAAKVQTVSRLRSLGYAAGTLADSRALVDATTQRADLDLLLDSGPLFLLGDIRIEGLERYREAAVRNVANFGPGEPYSEQKLQEYQERLAKVGLFESSSVRIEPDAAQAAAVPVVVRVREFPLQQATLGIGYSANTGQRLTLEHIHRRVFGLHWRSRSRLELGRDLKSAETELTSHPLPDNWRNIVALGVENLTSGSQERNSARLRVGRARDTKELDRLYYLELTRSNLHDVPTDTSTSATAVSGHYHWVFRRLDSVLLPTRGWSLTAQLGAGYSKSSDADNGPFGRTLARFNYYRPFGGDWYTQTRIEAGQVHAADNVGIPDTLLFRAGGDDSVRGYAYRSLGPVKKGVVTSGRVLLTGSAEVQHPITPRYPAFLWAVFVDAGNAAQDWGSYRPVFGYGTGVRWRSPVGPLRLDVAYGQDVGKVRLHLSVGVNF